MWVMWQYELHPRHLLNVATLPCESENTESVILQQEITKENCIRCIAASSKWTRVIVFHFFWVLYNNAFMKWFMTSRTCENAWRKLGWPLTRTLSMLRLTSGVTVWDHMCMLVVDILNTCSEMSVHLYDPSEHFMKLSVYYACNGYFVVNIKSWFCVHMHFWCFDFHKVV